MWRMRVAWVVAGMVIAGACAGKRGEAVPALGVNDVSVLFPAGAAEALWPATMPARGGVLLSAAQYARLETSLVREVEDEAEHAALRVVSLRFDPCFQVELGGRCQAQIRAVMQIPDGAGGFFDGAIHALYEVEAGRVGALRDGLVRLRGLAPENARAALGVSPALSAQGIDGAYGRALRTLVSEHAGEAALVRMTFMTRTFSRAGQWQFGGFAAGGERLAIGGLGAVTQQNVTRSTAGGQEYVVHPAFAEEDGRAGASARLIGRFDAQGRRQLHGWAMRQEDPARHLPDTTDCASCHLVGHVARTLEALEPELASASIAGRRGARVVGAAEGDADNLRAFGYFGVHAHVAQRTANETRAVLEAWSRVP